MKVNTDDNLAYQAEENTIGIISDSVIYALENIDI